MSTLPWIKVWTAVPHHPKIQRLERELVIHDALGIVIRLWCWTAAYHPDGEVPESHADAMVSAMIGDALSAPNGLAERNTRVTLACVTCGFLDPVDGGFRVHDWRDIQTVHVEAEERRRAQWRERQARLRGKRHASVTRDVTRDIDVTSRTEKEREIEDPTTTVVAPTNGARKPKPPPDPRHAPLVARLSATFLELRRTEYGFRGGQDAKAVKALLAFGPDDEIDSRWRRGLRLGTKFPGCLSLTQLKSNWNHLGGPKQAAASNSIPEFK